MSSRLIQTATFRGVSEQPINNVLIHAPSIIWVAEGKKNILYQDTVVSFEKGQWVIIPSLTYLSFINEPYQRKFLSRMISFLAPPPDDWLSDHKPNTAKLQLGVELTPTMSYFFEIASNMCSQNLDEEAQRHLLLAFYAEMRKVGYLDLLFPGNNTPLKEKLTHYLSMNPGYNHCIEMICRHFNMSKATLIRHLAAEGTSFREVLAEVRMGYALNLLQQSYTQTETALACGYKSAPRFAERFKHQFGLSPSEYIKTI